MPLESNVNPSPTSLLGRLWQNFMRLGEAIELSETERLERRVAALEAAARMSAQSNQQP